MYVGAHKNEKVLGWLLLIRQTIQDVIVTIIAPDVLTMDSGLC